MLLITKPAPTMADPSRENAPLSKVACASITCEQALIQGVRALDDTSGVVHGTTGNNG
jgi:hypothetical protein